MNILKKLFVTEVKTEQPVLISEPISTNVVSEQSDDLFKNLFMETEQPPAVAPKDNLQPSKISEFLNRNYESKGLREGYEYGTLELLDNSIKQIKSELLIILDQMIEEKRLGVLNLVNQIPAVFNIAPVVVTQLENAIVETKNSIADLQKQKELTVENEGWVMNGIHSYREGFIKGVITKQGENQLLYITSNFFTTKN